jgi:hypothetical protein
MSGRRGFKAAASGAFALLGLALAGCAGETPPAPCPVVAKLQDADRLTRFEGPGRDLTDVQFEARIGKVASTCEYDEDGYDVIAQVQFLANRGPAAVSERGDFYYFVAIVDATSAVLARQEFDSNFEFAANKTRAGVVEELEQRIPPTSGTPPYSIYVGFKLSPEELAFNRGKLR